MDMKFDSHISSSTTDLKAVVAPPPELLTSSALEDFVSVQMLQPLTFLL
jgi:hypothetical protein